MGLVLTNPTGQLETLPARGAWLLREDSSDGKEEGLMLTLPLVWAATQWSTVAIELPEATPSDTVARVVDTCNQALGAPRCVAAGGPEASASLYAIVRWEGAQLRVWLRRAGPNGVEVDRRDVTFSEQDAPQDRYITAGLIVAALTAGARLEGEPPSTEPPPTEAPPAEAPPAEALPAEAPPASAPTKASSEHHSALDVEAQLGQAVSEPKWGVGLRGSWIAHNPRLGVSLGVEHQRAHQPVELSWSSMSLGGVLHATPWYSLVGVEFSAQGLLQRLRAEAEREGRWESQSLWRGGGKLSGLLLFSAAPWLHPYVGASVTLLHRGFQLRLQDENLGGEPKLRGLFLAGVRLLPF